MCGLVGMAGDIPANYKPLFRDMLDICQVRGRHSTGVLKVDQSNKYTWFKRWGPPAYLFDSKDYEKTIESGLIGVLAGHCRHATVGEVSTKTAHPFDFDDHGICGMHNGTLRSYHSLKQHKGGQVDSETLYAYLAEEGEQEVFSNIEGAWACVWWDDNTKTLKFIRNKERPLWFTWNKAQTVMFWASEPWMFNALRRKIDMWEPEDRPSPYIQLPENTLWEFAIDAYAPANHATRRKITLKQPRIIEPKKPYQANQHRRMAWLNYGGVDDEDENLRDLPKKTEDKKSGNAPTQGQRAKTSVTLLDPDEKKKDAGTSSKSEGGEVTNPFAGIPETHLTPPKSLEEKTNTVGCNADFLNTSCRSSDTSTESKKSTKSGKPRLSLVATNSGSSQKTSKKSSSKGCGPSCESMSPKTTTTSSRHLNKSTVDYREVAGIPYITDRRTGTEYSEQQFDKNTKGICYFCDTAIGDLKEVADFLSPTKFVCVSCNEECEKEGVQVNA